jgi:high affinity sulfate transporter 1
MTDGPSATTEAPSWFPPARWLRTYEASNLPADALAGVTLAAYAIPVSLAYAALAGLPPEVGIYGYLLGGLGYAALGSSRHLAVGPTSAISLMVGGAVGQMAGGDAVRYGQIATLAGFMVAALCALAWLLRASTLTSFISETVLLGFKAGAGLTIASTQLAAFFGVPGGGDGVVERVLTVARQLPQWSPPTTAVAVAALALLVLGDRFLPGRPIALGVVALAIAAVGLTPLGSAGVAVVGRVPSGLPAIDLPAIRARDVDGALPLALGCLLLAYTEGVSAARTFAARHRYALDVRQELLGLGGANLLAAFGGGYPVAGGLSQSAVNEKAGARTPLALVFASATLAVCLLFLTGLVQNLPKAVLAAIVLIAVKGLIDLRGIARLRRVSRFEFRVAMVALVGVLAFGILKGVLLASVASILMLLARAADPPIAFLGRVPGTRYFSNLATHPENERIAGVLVVRVAGALLYFNAENVRRAVLERARAEGPGLRLVVIDMSSSPNIDLAAAHMLADLRADLAAHDVRLALAEASRATRALLRDEGLGDTLPADDRRIPVDEAVDAGRLPTAAPA